MLPLVIIGPDDTVREAFEAWAQDGIQPETVPNVLTYDTAEDAQYDLSDRLDDDENGEVRPDFAIGQDEAGNWECSVAYGPATFGAATTGQPQRLAHTGWTFVVGTNLAIQEQVIPRKVVDGVPQGADRGELVQQAATVLRCHLVVDAADQNAMRHLLRHLSDRERP
jgi:hypothetical protein